ncbi:MAG: MBL fold metallo-hydrolase [Acidimicrobiaceae bacterium]|nr:MBL fold metallo-hydrolase [Acidimicrobiaceae bacterium]
MLKQFYFKQLLSGQDFAHDDPLADEMVNFVYAVGDRDTSEAVLIDPAYDIKGLLRVLEADGMKCVGVLATHYHPDHVGGQMSGLNIEGITQLLTLVSVPIYIQTDETHYVRAVTGVGNDHLVKCSSGETISVGSIEIELIHTPGHTPGSQCFLVEDRLIAGDTLFLEGCGRTDLPGGDPAQMYESLTTKLTKVPDSVILYPGHYYSSESSATMGHTRQHNEVFHHSNRKQWLANFAPFQL